MSGLEVAGVVLGALPLVISALEHYAKGIITAKRYWRYKTELKALMLQVNTESGIFVNTIEQLFTGIVRIEQMADFMASTGSGIWRQQDIEARLKDRLRGSYKIYFDNVQGMESALRKMMEKLALDREGKPQFADPSLFKQEYKRLKFSISKSEYSEQIGTLRDFNQSLVRLTQQSLQLESSRATRPRLCPNFKALRDHAKNLYDTLRSGLNCNSGCGSHAVNLRLEARCPRFESVDDVPEKVPFRVIFSHTSRTRWQEADVRYIVDSPPGLQLPTTRSAPKQVRFAQSQLGASAQGHLNQGIAMTVLPKPAVMVSPTSLHPIQNVCAALQMLPQPQQDYCMGYLLDALQRKHGIYPVFRSSGDAQQQWIIYPLRQILTGQASTGRRFTQLDKLRIALHISSSILQLYKTPWLRDDWDDEDVYFVQKPGADLTKIYEHPYVYRQFIPHADATTPQTQSHSFRVIRNQSLYSLGLLLIELWYGQSIGQLQKPADLNHQGTPGATWCTAERIVDKELEFEAGKRYTDAVRRCLRCDFNRSDIDLDNEDFQKAVFEGVVVPLEVTLKHFSGDLT